MKALTMQTRHWRQGETWLLLLAIFLAVFASYGLTAAGALMQESLLKTSAELMGSDRTLSATRKADETWLQKAQQLNLKRSEQWGFNTMVFAGSEDDAPMQLISVKAVDMAYPVKGELQATGNSGTLKQRPAAGEIYLDRRLQELLQVELGESVQLGEADLIVSAWLDQEPDAGFSLFGNLPTLLMRLEDVEMTQVVQPGSRIWYRHLFAGTTDALKAYDKWLEPKLNAIFRYRGIQNQNSSLAKTLERNDVVLRLAGLLTLLLSLAALAVIANRFAERQQREVALFKALGVRSNSLRLRFITLFTQVFVLASTLALFAAHGALAMMVKLLSLQMPTLELAWVPSALLLSLLSSLGGSLFFLWRPFNALLNTSAATLIQGAQPQIKRGGWIWLLALLVALTVLLMAFSKSTTLALILLAAGVGAVVFVSLLSQLLLFLLNRYSESLPLAWRLTIKRLNRNLAQNRLLMSGFTLACFMVMTIFYLRLDLIENWQEQLPDGAANHFAMNIQPWQKEGFLNWLEQNQIQSSYTYPMVRGRLASINGKLIAEQVNEQNEGRRYIQRELNLTWRSELPEGNELLAGSFLTGPGEVSVESDMAERLLLKLGDQIELDIAGQAVSAKVTSFRKVNWNNLRPNFFLIFSDDVLASFSPSYLASFYLPPESKALPNQLARSFPTLTLINVNSILKRLETLIHHSALALTVILLLVTLASVLLLLAQIRAGLDARAAELVTMQTLGASRLMLIKTCLLEFCLMGVIAGFIAAVISEALLASLFWSILEMGMSWHPSLWLVGPLFAAMVITGFGWQGCRQLLKEGALARLRAQVSGG